MSKIYTGDGWSFEPAEKKDAKKAKPADKKSHKLRIRIENRPGGKVVTILPGLHYLGEQKLSQLAQSLKIACGTGGTVKDGAVELQGNQRERVEEWLQKNGWKL